MYSETRAQIVEALEKNSNAHAVARQIGDVSHVSVWHVAQNEHIELAAGKARRGKHGLSPEMRMRIIEAIRKGGSSPRLIAKQLGNVSHVTVWKIARELTNSAAAGRTAA